MDGAQFSTALDYIKSIYSYPGRIQQSLVILLAIFSLLFHWPRVMFLPRVQTSPGISTRTTSLVIGFTILTYACFHSGESVVQCEGH